MPKPPSAYDLHQQSRWLRHDAHRWLRHDFARWLKPGTDPEEVYPHLKRQRQAAEDERAAVIAEGYRLQAVLRAEVDELKAELKRQRLEEAKYSPDQPRVPGGNPRGGQWTDRNGGSGNAYDATTSTPVASRRSEGDGTRGSDDRLAASDEPKPGRAAMLGIMARAAARAIEAYRSGNLLLDLFGNKNGAVAVTTIDDKDIFGSNSTSSTYTARDRQDAMAMRSALIENIATK